MVLGTRLKLGPVLNRFKGEEKMIRSGIRKVLAFSLIMALAMVVVSAVHALQGGPDNFGYRYIDSLDRNGPDFHMETLDGIVRVSNTSMTTSYPIGFDFEFYGRTYNYFHIGGNGYITFTLDGDYDNHVYTGQEAVSTADPTNIIAPFWSHNDVQT